MPSPRFTPGNVASPNGRAGNGGRYQQRTQAKAKAEQEEKLKLEIAASEQAQKLIAELGDVSREELVRRNTGWLSFIIQRAVDSDQLKPAIAALTELNKMKNLYALAAGADDSLTRSLAHVDESGLGDLMLREVQVLLEKRAITNSEAIQ